MQHWMFGRPRRDAAPVVIAQCAAVTGAVVAAAAGSSLSGAMIAAVATAVLTTMPVHGHRAFGWAGVWWRFRRRIREPGPAIVDFAAGEGLSVGLCWYGTEVVAVVEVSPTVGEVTRLTRERVESQRVLPLPEIAACLARHDVVLDGIDVVVRGRRLSDSTAGRVYGELVGPLPAASTGTVWLALRLDSTSCAAAVARRGGGADGAARAVTVAARRVVRVLSDRHHHARILTAAEIVDAARSVVGSADPAEPHIRWGFVPSPAGYGCAAVVRRRHLDRHLLPRLWSAPLASATLTVRLRHCADERAVQVGALVLATADTPPGPALAGTRRLWGRQHDGSRASAPTAAVGLEDLVPTRSMRLREVDALALPMPGCGQLVGADESGAAVAVRVTGRGVRSVHVAGELYLAQQVVFRAVAVGARVVVRTDRVQAWRRLLAAAEPDRLRLGGPDGDGRGFDTIVYDGVRPSTVPPGITAIHVHTQPERCPREHPDVAIVQPGSSGDRVVLTTTRARVSVTLVTIEAETAYIGRPRAAEHAR